LREHAETTEAAFGYLSDEADDAGIRTALEDALGLFPEDTLPMLDRQVRGYSWITVVSAGVADLLGGVDAMSKSQAFHEASGFLSGSLWLEASPDLIDYDAERQRRVFETLARAIPPGVPQRDRRARNRRLVYEDAAEVAGRSDNM
jgi:hypothetical protein